MTGRLAITLTALLSVFSARGVDTVDIQTRQLRSVQERGSLVSPLSRNPSIRPLWENTPAGKASAGYFHRHGNEMALDFDPDNGVTLWQAQANALIAAGKNTIWGAASYDNGKHIDRQLCLSSDWSEVYPYVNTTLTGGDMHQEHYRFGGGWSAPLSPEWRVGATLGYVAGHAFRQEDPRPRNITGELTASIGAAYSMSRSYLAGADISLRRYTQGNSVMFVSEMGQESIYHLTGLGSFYRRFTGLGNKMAYTGYEPGIGLQLFPVARSGFFASARYGRLHMRCVLTALNRLPMASIDQDVIHFNAGWRKILDNTEYSFRIHYNTRKRNGTENIFGDPASGVYPRIGKELMYTDSRHDAGVALSWRLKTPDAFLRITPSGAFRHRRESYDHDTRFLKADRFHVALDIAGARIFPHGIFSELNIRGACLLRASSELRLPAAVQQTDASAPMAEALAHQQRTYYDAISGNAQMLGAEWRLSKSIQKHYAIGFSIQWSYLHSTTNTHTNNLNASLEFHF